MVNKKLRKVQKNNKFAYAMITVAAVLYICGIQAIMQVAHVLSSELDAVPLVITLLLPKLTPYYGLFYLAINIPIILIFFKKLNRKFILRTIYFLVVSTAFSSIFFIPGVEDWFQTLIINAANKEAVKDKVLDDKWPMLVLPVLGGALVGSAIAISWKFGGSSAGADVIIYYFSTKRKVHVSSMLFLVSLIILCVSFCVLISLQEEVRKNWLPSLCGSFIYITVLSMMMNFIFPKYSKVQIEIHSSKIEEIKKFLKKEHGHPFRISKSISGYTDKDVYYFTTVILVLEVKDFLERVKSIDSNSWISAIAVSNVFGRFNTHAVDSI